MTHLNTAYNMIPFCSPEDAIVHEAAIRYFNNPSKENLNEIYQLLSEKDKDINYKAALIVQAANTVLNEEIVYITKVIEDRGVVIQCRSGCTACCKQAILCDPFEAALIGFYLLNNHELRKFFNKAYQEWDERTKDIRNNFLIWAEQYYIKGIDTGNHQVLDYYTPCPFLCNDLCQIYPVRPYVCRAYIALSETCGAPVDPGERAGMMGIDLGSHTKHKNARTAMSKLLCRKFGIDSMQIYGKHMPEIVHNVLLAASHP
jgi:Fe-S-cluster containining protein